MFRFAFLFINTSTGCREGVHANLGQVYLICRYFRVLSVLGSGVIICARVNLKFPSIAPSESLFEYSRSRIASVDTHSLSLALFV